MNEAIKVLHLSTHNEECGIAVFQQNIVDGMGKEHAIHNEFFPISPNKLKLLQGAEFTTAVQQLTTQLQSYDVLHIQEEHSFYNNAQLMTIMRAAKQTGKKIMFTLHTPPHAMGKHMPVVTRPSLHPRSWVQSLRSVKRHRDFVTAHIEPLKLADVLVVMSNAALESFASFGVPRELMRIIEHPVPASDRTKSSHAVAEALHKKSGDVILSSVGFLAEAKGNMAAVKALTYLPENYKLAIVGGSHPSGDTDAFYDKVCDLIRDLGLQERVYITGYIADETVRDAMLRETDICLYPYDRSYYGYVSSGALAVALANDMPVVGYPIQTFQEVNNAVPCLVLCRSANYYELAREVQRIDTAKQAKFAKEYADRFSIKNQAARFADVYRELAGLR